MVLRPFPVAARALEIRRLRRRHPYVYRRFISDHDGVRPETDREYLERLRQVHEERAGRRTNPERTGARRLHEADDRADAPDGSASDAR